MTTFARACVGAICAAFIAVAGVEAAPPPCLGKPATIVAQGTIQGTAPADVIVAGPGRDRIDGRGGNDRVCVRWLGIGFVLNVAPASRAPALVTARAQKHGAIHHDDVSVVAASSV